MVGACLAQASASSAAGQAQGGEAVRITIRAALIGKNFQPRPLAAFPLEISGPGRRDTVRTSLSGQVELRLPPGSYRAQSLEPVAEDGKALTWDIDFRVGKAELELELTSANAIARPAASSVTTQPAAAMTAKEILSRYSGAVVRVEAGLSHGTGFLIQDPDGAVVTNDHVIAGSRFVSVYLDSVTRVRATVVRRDRAADIAILKLARGRVADRPRIPMSVDLDEPPAIEPGDAVFALGYPLNQGLTLTAGIVSGVRSGAIISDVAINPGNSGGPLISSAGVAVAINTFGEVSPTGPGLGGAVLASQAAPVLREARAAFATHEEPGPELLPTMPHYRIPADALNELVRSAEGRGHQKLYQEADANNFVISLSSPVANAIMARAASEYIAADRRKRESSAGVSADERYGDGAVSRDWEEYVGNSLTPVVQLLVLPKEGETGGSLFRRLMLGPTLQATWRFKGDVRDIQFYRDAAMIEPIRGGVGPLRRYENNQWVAMRDVANYGRLVLDPRVFAPRTDGSVPQIVVGIDDLKRPTEKFCFAFGAELTAAIWNDFAPLAGDIWPGEGLPAASGSASGRTKVDKRLIPSACKVAGGASWVY